MVRHISVEPFLCVGAVVGRKMKWSAESPFQALYDRARSPRTISSQVNEGYRPVVGNNLVSELVSKACKYLILQYIG